VGARSRLKRLRQRCRAYVGALPTPAAKLAASNELVAMGVFRQKDAAEALDQSGARPDPVRNKILNPPG
jgi:hypothetical protein